MKIVDQTPFYKENGELSSIDRAKAIMQFGTGWFKEVEAQKSVIAVLGKALDKSFTLLVNVVPPGLEARIPLILVGPTGVYVMTVTPLVGMFRAKGDQWGTISGNTFRPEKPNLLVRTERMARAIQVFLQRHGYIDLNGVEAILITANPTTHVDSMRPITRIIMRDMLEHFAVSVSQARVVLNPESVSDVVNHLLTSPTQTPSTLAKPVIASSTTATERGITPNAPAIVIPGSEAAPVFTEVPIPPPPLSETSAPIPDTTPAPPRKGLTRKQIIYLAGMFIIWCLIVAIFAIIAVKNMYPQ